VRRGTITASWQEKGPGRRGKHLGKSFQEKGSGKPYRFESERPVKKKKWGEVFGGVLVQKHREFWAKVSAQKNSDHPIV